MSPLMTTLRDEARVRLAADLIWIWPVCPDGYALRRLRSGQTLVLAGSIEDSYRDCLQFPDLWQRFIKTKTDNEILAFTAKFGVLEHGSFKLQRYKSLDQQFIIDRSIMLEHWRHRQSELIKAQKALFATLAGKQRVIDMDFDSKVRYSYNRQGRLEVDVQPNSLISGIAMQMTLNMIGVPEAARVCEECGRIFPVRRKDKRFCTRRCNDKSYNRRRAHLFQPVTLKATSRRSDS
jgi:hypothetical protein